MMIAKSVERKRPGLPWMIPSWAVALVLSLTIMVGIGLASPNSSAAIASTAGTAAPRSSALAPGSTCELAWRVVSSPGSDGESHLYTYGVAAVSADDIWAVGFYYGSSVVTMRTLTMHWDGVSWTTVPSPNVGSYYSNLVSVAAVSADDVWAVGNYHDAPTNAWRTLTMHWDGVSWSIVPSPNVGSDITEISAVAAISANDVWAVGGHKATYWTRSTTVTMHWDGVAWSIVNSPNGFDGHLFGVSVVSSNDVWAVGRTSFDRTLTLHWDGSTWNFVPSPDIEPGWPWFEDGLSGVAAISANDVWAVGNSCLLYESADGFVCNESTQSSFMMHWDGADWSMVPGPSHIGITQLAGVAAVTADDVWAVGMQSNSEGRLQTLVEHWNGSTWSTVSSPDFGYRYSRLFDVVAVAGDDVWAVGTTPSPGNWYDGTLVLHYSADCPVTTPTPTSTAAATPTSTPTPGSDFTLSVSPTSRSVGRPSTTTYTVSLASVNSYSGSISLSVSGLPARTEHSFSPNPVTLTPGGSGPSVLTISTRRNTPAGTYTLTITGTDGVRTRSQTVILVVNR